MENDGVSSKALILDDSFRSAPRMLSDYYKLISRSKEPLTSSVKGLQYLFITDSSSSKEVKEEQMM